MCIPREGRRGGGGEGERGDAPENPHTVRDEYF